jgi:hypothetical protein
MILGLVVTPGRGGHPILNRENWFCIAMSHLTNRFDLATIEILSVAIEDAWREIQNVGGPLARPVYARITRAVIAKRITEMAKKGERDRRKLSEHGIQSVIVNQKVSLR